VKKLSRREFWLLAVLIALTVLVLAVGLSLDLAASGAWLNRETLMVYTIIFPLIISGIVALVQLTRSGYAPAAPVADTGAAGPGPSPDPAGEIGRQLRQSLFLARSLRELEQLRNRVEAGVRASPGDAELRDLRDDVRRAIAAERARAGGMSVPAASARRVPASAWGVLIALIGSALALGWLLGPWSEPPKLANAPDRDWIADWSAVMAPDRPAPAGITGLRLEIGAEHSRLTVRLADGAVCGSPVAVVMEDGVAWIETPKALDCDRGRALPAIALRCREADAGAAACGAVLGNLAPFRVALVRVAPADWDDVTEPEHPPEPAPPTTPLPPAPDRAPDLQTPQQSSPQATGGESLPEENGLWQLLLRGDESLTEEDTVASVLRPLLELAAASVPRTLPRDRLRGGGLAPEMVGLPAGCFLMGSPPEEPGRYSNERQHRVCVDAFAIGRTEVTFDDYDAFAAATGREPPDDRGWGRGRRPVIGVSWLDASVYAAWLSDQTGKAYRLPTEAEWEYAARAGTVTPFWTGDCIDTDQANYDGTSAYAGCGSSGVYRRQPLPVGSLAANPWGLHDILGNVWEWTCSGYDEDYAGSESCHSLFDSNPYRGLRGGSWVNGGRYLRAALRGGNPPGSRYGSIGLRLARGFQPGEPAGSTR
jgi:formylglycine-generating enzyme required for sulfatase activity